MTNVARVVGFGKKENEADPIKGNAQTLGEGPMGQPMAHPQNGDRPAKGKAIGHPTRKVGYLERLCLRDRVWRLRIWKGAILSKERQYRKKEAEDHLLVVRTTSGGTPAANNSVVPPIRKEWPDVRG